MNIRKEIWILLLVMIQINGLLACSCDRIYFCEYMEHPILSIAVRGKVIKKAVYADDNVATYLEVEKVFRDDYGITDTIKLYGLTYESSCQVRVDKYEIGQTLYVAIGLESTEYTFGFDFNNPDAATENYWGVAPFLCYMNVLKMENGIVSGSIKEDIYEYPADLFESRIADCSFSQEELDRVRCSSDDFLVYPNPSSGESIKIQNDFTFSSIDRIKVFAIDGRLVYQQEWPVDPWQKTEFSLQGIGLYIAEITCEEEKFYKKIIVEN